VPIVIQKIAPDMVDQAVAVFRAVLGDFDFVSGAAILARLQQDTGIFYAAFDVDTGRMVGIKLGYIDGSTCVGRGIAVLPDYRRQGIGAKLLHQFEQDLAARGDVSSYVFGSSSDEGVPFHLAMGYQPRALVQFENAALRDKLDLSSMQITHEGYNDAYHVYQVYIELGKQDRNLANLRRMQHEMPEVNVQLLFAKSIH
jgi:GNAT superfamily N-acetyltransferase